MRHVIFDTETTGLSPIDGHRVIEIGCVELVDGSVTGRTFHHYCNPERAIDDGAVAVHGLTSAFLQDKPLFKEIAADLRAFFEDADLVAHNAPFDVGFINAELAKLALDALDPDRIVDTLAIARKRFPGARNDLDSLCDRFEISRSERTLHGALLDARLTAQVFIELTGGRQRNFALDPTATENRVSGDHPPVTPASKKAAVRPTALPSRLTEAERRAHAAFTADLGDAETPSIWTRRETA